MSSSREPVHLDAVIARAVRQATSTGPAFGVTIDFDSTVVRTVLGDERQLLESLVEALERVARDDLTISIHVGLVARRRAAFTVASTRAAVRFAWPFQPAPDVPASAPRNAPVGSEDRVLFVSSDEARRTELVRLAREIGVRSTAAGSSGIALHLLEEAERLGHPYGALVVASANATTDLINAARGAAGTSQGCWVIVVDAGEPHLGDLAGAVDARLSDPVTGTALARCLAGLHASGGARAA